MSTPQTDVKPGERDPAALLAAQRYRLPGFTTEVGPLGHLQTERHRLTEMEWISFTVTPVGATIGSAPTARRTRPTRLQRSRRRAGGTVPPRSPATSSA